MAKTKLSQCLVELQGLLGRGYQKTSIFTSALFTVISIFYVFTLGSYLHVTVYHFLLRVTYVKPFNDYLVTRYFDSIIICLLTLLWLLFSLRKSARIIVCSIFGALFVIGVFGPQPNLLTLMELATFPMILFFLFCQKKFQDKKKPSRSKSKRMREFLRNFNSHLIFNYFAVAAIILGVLSILISLSVILMSPPISLENIFTTKQIPVDNYGYEIFILFSAISPVLLIVIFFCLPAKLLAETIFLRIVGHNRKPRMQFDERLARSENQLPRKLLTSCMLLSIIFSMSLAFIPQLPTVNKDNQQIGSDSESYVEWLVSLRQTTNLQDFVKAAFTEKQGDRPFSLIIAFLLTNVINAPLLDAVEYLPIILGPALVLVVYFLTRELTSNEITSLFAASLTGLGYFQVSMGIYAGFYANWIALLVGYSSLIFFFRFLRTSNKIALLIFFVLLGATLLSHAYTWSVFVIVMIAFIFVCLAFKKYPRKRSIMLMLIVLSTVGLDFIKTTLLRPLGSAAGVELTAGLAQSSIVTRDLNTIWGILIDATQEHFGGIFCNVIVLGLVIYWFIRSNLRTDYNTFLVVFLMAGIPAFFLGDWIIQSRVFYNIPFQIPAAIALSYLSRHESAIKTITPIYVWLVAISIWTVSNFYEVLP